jgi:hypothetical protein
MVIADREHKDIVENKGEISFSMKATRLKQKTKHSALIF